MSEQVGTYTQPAHGWTCFHCGETFTTPGGARDHFGATPENVAGCLIDRVAIEEGGRPERGRGLLMALRKAEAACAEKDVGWQKAENELAMEQALRQAADARATAAERDNVEKQDVIATLMRENQTLAERATAAEQERDKLRGELVAALDDARHLDRLLELAQDRTSRPVPNDWSGPKEDY